MIKHLVLAGAISISGSAFCQQLQLVGSSGSEAETASGALSYSVGELVVANGSNGDFSQGYQQGNLFVTGVGELPSNVHVALYPNPTQDALFLESESLGSFDLISLYDSKGALVWSSRNTNSNKMQIDMRSFGNGTYFLRLEGAQSPLQYQVVKVH